MASTINHYKEILIEFLNNIQSIPKIEEDSLSKIIKQAKYKRGEKILISNEIETRISFLIEGIVHQYYVVDGRMRTTNIVLPAMTFSSYISYSSGKPSEQIQEAIEDCSLLYAEKSDIDSLLKTCPIICLVYLKLFERVHLKREIRGSILHYKSGSERYKKFLEEEPNANEYIRLVPQKVIASYLGLSPEAYSRAKSKFNSKT